MSVVITVPATFLQIALSMVCLMVAIAYSTLLERKAMGSIQQRCGPNVVGIAGLCQPLADGLKLLLKETTMPSMSHRFLFLASPVITFHFSLIGWLVIPLQEHAVQASYHVGLLYSLAASSCGVYGILLAGWSSNSKYAFMGALRSAAQMVSYEVSFGLILAVVFIGSGSFSLSTVVTAQHATWFGILFLPNCVLFGVTILAETNRAPFDLIEAEGELVSGYNVEYGSMGFALFFLGEYCAMLLMGALLSTCYLGGWFVPFLVTASLTIATSSKIVLTIFLTVWIRAAFPRYRYDQLMALGWKVFLPFSLTFVVVLGGLFAALTKGWH
jgi:NADH-quinone oxidoreductase subunit H